MNYTALKKALREVPFIVMAVLLLAAPSFAATFNLRAAATTVSMPDGSTIPAWGFECVSATGGTCSTTGVVSVPGPELSVNPGETSLTINLTNDLTTVTGVTTAVSVVIPGQSAVYEAPVFAGNRATSFTQTAAAGGGTHSYIWNNLKPGTYLYQSGTHPAVQVQMGLYGALKVNQAAGHAYNAATAYTAEVTLLYSEIDKWLHEQVAGGQYGTALTSTLDYRADYFLINGQPYKQGVTLPAGAAGETTLIRFLNAGLRSHVPALLGGHMKLIAEDGNLYPYPKEQYSMLLAAGKTIDALWTPLSTGTYSLYDRSLHLTAGGQPGGMIAKLEVGGTSVNQAPVALDAAYVTDVATPVAITLGAYDPEGSVLTYTVLTNPANGALSGSAPNLTYTPSSTLGPDSFTFKVNDGTADSNVATVSITVTVVNIVPVANPQNVSTNEDTPVAVTLTASDGNGDPLTYAIVTGPAHGTLSGTAPNLTYTPAANYNGLDSFTFKANDGKADSNVATVSIDVISVNDAPVAQNDSATIRKNKAVTINVLANDTDVDGTLNAASVTITVPPAHARAGFPTINTTTGAITYRSTNDFTGADTIKYTVRDNQNDLSNEATVTITVTP